MSAVTYHNHHIIPRHAGGTDDPDNIVRLTVAEHAEAHRLLFEQYGRLQDKVAWLMLAGKNDEAEAARLELVRSPEIRAKMSAAMVEYYRSPTTRIKRSKTMTGRKRSSQHCANLSVALKGNDNAVGCVRSPETRAKISAGRKRYLASHRSN